jgi:hypothetical protein
MLVACRSLGEAPLIDWVRVKPLRAGPDEPGSGVQWSALYDPYHVAPYDLDPAELARRMRWQAVIGLAGVAADARGMRVSSNLAAFRGGGQDYQETRLVIADHQRLGRPLDIGDVCHAACDLVRAEWRAVDGLANRLVQSGFLPGDEVEQLCPPLLTLDPQGDPDIAMISGGEALTQ